MSQDSEAYSAMERVTNPDDREKTMLFSRNYTFRFAYKYNTAINIFRHMPQNNHMNIGFFPLELIGPEVIFDIRGPDSDFWVYSFTSDLTSNTKSKPVGRVGHFWLDRADTGKPPPLFSAQKKPHDTASYDMAIFIVPVDHEMEGKPLDRADAARICVAVFKIRLITKATFIKMGFLKADYFDFFANHARMSPDEMKKSLLFVESFLSATDPFDFDLTYDIQYSDSDLGIKKDNFLQTWPVYSPEIPVDFYQ
ncbi:hypothetical protein JR316_0005693 [Psilocybe cubensis]|uniref:Uncharacterized protein n=2 Tax=Psilocybe cubensis TaxID=181762 RepID=A0ACB8GZJ7_PSICU|nr:hypothetical protein JR316_0005693 [Psilocybe cubensis]KAH9481173.1 hypothetical protein JR316_0005693 [Psilocybe cubensis]